MKNATETVAKPDKVASAVNAFQLGPDARHAALRFSPYVHDHLNAADNSVRATFRTAAHDLIRVLRRDEPALVSALDALHVSYATALPAVEN